MSAPEIPKNIITAIEKLWPEGVVEKFDEMQSYFVPIRPRLEQDLREVRGASLGPTEAAPDKTGEWQSFHVFLLVPDGDESQTAGYSLAVSKVAPFAVLNLTAGNLRSQIAAVLKKYRIVLLDQSILDLSVDGLSAGEGILLEEPLRVVDAFFFRAT